MNVHSLHLSLASPRIHGLKNECLGSRDLQQSQILRRGADEDEIVVPDIIERRQRPTLHPQLAVEKAENPVQFMDRQDLAHSGVMIENRRMRIGGRAEVTHVRLRPPHKVGVAENHPGWLRRSQKRAPENLIDGRYGLPRSALAS